MEQYVFITGESGGWRGDDDPIRVAVGPDGGLPENAIAQIALDDHVFYNGEMAQ